MAFERAPQLPAKAKLTWQISRLILDASGTVWFATASKGGRVAVTALPLLSDASREAEWLVEIESAFELQSFDPAQCEDGVASP